MDKNKLIKLKERIQKTKTEVNKLEGRREGIIQDLKEKWECDSLEEAKELLEDLKEEAKELATKLESYLEELNDKYDFS